MTKSECFFFIFTAMIMIPIVEKLINIILEPNNN